MQENKETAGKESATIIIEEILNVIQDTTALSWPLKVYDFQHEKREPLDLVWAFIEHVLNDSHYCESAVVAECFC